jgi:hypothetical protein
MASFASISNNARLAPRLHRSEMIRMPPNRARASPRECPRPSPRPEARQVLFRASRREPDSAGGSQSSRPVTRSFRTNGPTARRPEQVDAGARSLPGSGRSDYRVPFSGPGMRLCETVVRRWITAWASSTFSPAGAARGPLTWSERLEPLPNVPAVFPSTLAAGLFRLSDGPTTICSSLLVPVPIAPIGRPFGAWPAPAFLLACAAARDLDVAG